MTVLANAWLAAGGFITGVLLPAEKLFQTATQAARKILPPLQGSVQALADLKGSLEMTDITNLPTELAKIGQEVLSFIENNPEALAQVGNDLFTDAVDYLRGNKTQMIPDLQKTIQAIPQLPAIVKDANVSLWIATGLADMLIPQAQAALANGQAKAAASQPVAPPAGI